MSGRCHVSRGIRAMTVRLRLLALSLSLGLALLLDIGGPVAVTAAAHQKVLLKEIQALTFSKHGMTTGRRSAPLPQMQCVDGPCRWAPNSILCKNVGFDGVDVLWKCQADLEKGIRLGQVSVSCEGYEYPDDPYILRGSCSLEFSLEGQAEVEKGQYRRGYDRHHDQYGTHEEYHSSSRHHGSGSNWVTWLVVAAACYVIYKGCTGGNGGGRGGGYGGGGGGSGFYPGGGGGGSGVPPPSYDSSCPPSSSSSSSGPGFWSGALGGGALGYMLGSRGSRRGGYTSQWSSGPSSSGWSSGRSWGSSSSSSSSPASFGTSSSSSFGGTRRR